MMTDSSFAPWSIDAANLAEHADNPVHTLAGGRAAGYDGAVVAGTTIYAYLTRPVAAAWGAGWVTGGACETAFRAPVIEGDTVAVADDGSGRLVARVGDRECAWVSPTLTSSPLDDPTGAPLEPLVFTLTDRWTGYAARAGEDLGLYREQELVHPVVWPSLANRVFATQLVTGAWVHTRSHIRHLGVARPGDTVTVESYLIDRFASRAGERAVVDIRMRVGDGPVAAVEHEAIVALNS